MSGPWGFPLVGCLPFLVGDHIHAILWRWVQLYGPIYQLRLGSSRVVVANDLQSIREIQMNKEFAGRPNWVTTSVVGKYGNNMSFTDQTAANLAHRRIVSRSLLKKNAAEKAIIQAGGRLWRMRHREENLLTVNLTFSLLLLVRRLLLCLTNSLSQTNNGT